MARQDSMGSVHQTQFGFFNTPSLLLNSKLKLTVVARMVCWEAEWYSIRVVAGIWLPTLELSVHVY